LPTKLTDAVESQLFYARIRCFCFVLGGVLGGVILDQKVQVPPTTRVSILKKTKYLYSFVSEVVVKRKRTTWISPLSYE